MGFSLLSIPLLTHFSCPTLHAGDPGQRRRTTEFKFIPSTWGTRPHFKCHSYSSIFMTATRSLTQNWLSTWVSFFLSFLQSPPFSPSPSSVDYSVITAPVRARAHRPLWVFRIRQHRGNATRLRHKSKTHMKHCRHAITVKHEACNVCSPRATGNMRLTNCQFNSAHNFSIILCKFSFHFTLQAKLGHITYLHVAATGATKRATRGVVCISSEHGQNTNVAYFWIYRIFKLYYRESDLIPILRHFTVFHISQNPC